MQSFGNVTLWCRLELAEEFFDLLVCQPPDNFIPNVHICRILLEQAAVGSEILQRHDIARWVSATYQLCLIHL